MPKYVMGVLLKAIRLFMSQTITQEHKILYIRSYLHFRTGLNVRHLRPPENHDQTVLMNHMYHVGKNYMKSIGKELTILDR
jgi:hypothetical protein